MTNLVTGIIGIAGVFVFLGIILWWIKELPLIIIVVLVLALLVYDFVLTLRSGGSNGGTS
jgi:hypothetical protein